MEAGELMIDDLVWYSPANERETRVTEIRKYGEEWAITGMRHPDDPLNQGIEELFNVEILKPIPLTKEFFEKNGFSINGYATYALDNNSWLEYYFPEYRLRRYWSGIDEWENHSRVRDTVFACHCHYVHELQHALKMCCVDIALKA